MILPMVRFFEVGVVFLYAGIYIDQRRRDTDSFLNREAQTVRLAVTMIRVLTQYNHFDVRRGRIVRPAINLIFYRMC
jgi:hypothetical protein